MRTELTHDAELSLWVYGDKVQIIATNPGWHMQPGRTVAVTVSVDGDTFRGSGSIENSHTLLVPNLTKAFFGGIRDGSEMVVNYGGVRWDVDLAGTTAATDDMVRCIQEARLGLIS